MSRSTSTSPRSAKYEAYTAVQAAMLAAEESILIKEVVLAAFSFFSLYIIMKLRRKVE